MLKEIQIFFPAMIAAIVVIVGWYVVHILNSKRDQANKRRDLQVQYLINAYRQLEFVSNREITPNTAPEFEKAIADIQLFGTAKQVSLAQQFSVGFAKNGAHSLDELLADLRGDLREELGLEKVGSSIKYLRISHEKS